MKQRRKKNVDWGYFFLLIGIVTLFAVSGFIWGFNVGVEFG